jgi:hypothetical protein
MQYFIVLAGGPWGQSRFRHPFMPLVCALAAWAMPDARPRLRQPR